MRLAHPWFLLILLIIPFLIAYTYRKKRNGSLHFSTISQVKNIKPSLRQRFMFLPLLLKIIALILIAIALAQPQEGKEQVRDYSKGIAIEMVIDRSSSMGAEMNYEGKRLTRLEVVKRIFNEFVMGNGKTLPGRHNDLIGMVSFARYADTISPLTLAHGALTQFLENVQLVKRKNEDGTAIGDAIALASARLRTAEETLSRQLKEEENFEIKSKIIILLTDGQNNSGKRLPPEAAALAKKWGIKIYAIGVGGSEGMVRQQGILGSFLFRMGQGVDHHTLQSIADSTGGQFWTADDADSLRSIYKEIDQLEKSEIESIRYLDYKELFLPFVLVAMALMAGEVILSSTLFRKLP